MAKLRNFKNIAIDVNNYLNYNIVIQNIYKYVFLLIIITYLSTYLMIINTL